MDIQPISLLRHTAETAGPAPVERLQDQRQVHEAVRQLNANNVFGSDNELTFVVDRESRRLLLRVVNRVTNEVLLQVPPEYAVRLAESLPSAKR